MDPGLLAAVLGREWGIGLRHGCFCAHPCVMRLLGVGAAEVEKLARKAELNDHSGFPGLLRISTGLCNTRQEAGYVAEASRDLLDRGAPASVTSSTAPPENTSPKAAPPGLKNAARCNLESLSRNSRFAAS